MTEGSLFFWLRTRCKSDVKNFSHILISNRLTDRFPVIKQYFLELRSIPWHVWCNLSLLASSEPFLGVASTALLPQAQCWVCPRERREYSAQPAPGTTHLCGCTSLGLELSVCPAKGQPWCVRHDQNSHVPGDQNYPWSSSDTYTWLPGLPAGFPGSICLWQLCPYTLQCASHFISLSLKKVVKNLSSIKVVLFLSLIVPKICGRAWGFFLICLMIFLHATF